MPRVDEENARDVPPVEPMEREQAVNLASTDISPDPAVPTNPDQNGAVENGDVADQPMDCFPDTPMDIQSPAVEPQPDHIPAEQTDEPSIQQQTTKTVNVGSDSNNNADKEKSKADFPADKMAPIHVEIGECDEVEFKLSTCPRVQDPVDEILEEDFSSRIDERPEHADVPSGTSEWAAEQSER